MVSESVPWRHTRPLKVFRACGFPTRRSILVLSGLREDALVSLLFSRC
jgi:hypothetical protein